MHAGMVIARAKQAVESGKEPLQIRIPTAVKRAFKSTAALRGMEPNELFVEVWNHYQQTCRADTGKGKEK
jgi:hypothetical protein